MVLIEFFVNFGKYYVEVFIDSGLVGVVGDGIDLINLFGSGVRFIVYCKLDGKIMFVGVDIGLSLMVGVLLIRMLIDVDNRLLWMYVDVNIILVLVVMFGDNICIVIGGGILILNVGGVLFIYVVFVGYILGFGVDLDKYNNRLVFVGICLDLYDKGIDIIFFNDCLRILLSNDGFGVCVRFGISFGKWVWEVMFKIFGVDCVIGIGCKEILL